MVYVKDSCSGLVFLELTEKLPLTCTETEGEVTNLKVIYIIIYNCMTLATDMNLLPLQTLLHSRVYLTVCSRWNSIHT